MSQLTNLASTALAQGKTVTVLVASPSAAGSASRRFALETDTVLVSVFATAVSGDLDIKVYTQVGDDDSQAVEIISFPTITAPTTELVLKKAALAAQYVRVEITYTGACAFTIKAKGIQSGEASVRLLGQNEATAYATVVGTTTSLLIPAAISDRVGIALHNTSASQIVYIGFTNAEATSADAWEIAPGEKMGLDVASGVAIYARAASGSVNVKIMEAGS